MATYDYKYLVTQCKRLFSDILPEDHDILYKNYSKQPNTLHIIFKDNFRPEMIFVYNDMSNYKLMSKACYDEEEDAILKLRTELTKVQKTLRGERRKKNI